MSLNEFSNLEFIVIVWTHEYNKIIRKNRSVLVKRRIDFMHCVCVPKAPTRDVRASRCTVEIECVN